MTNDADFPVGRPTAVVEASLARALLVLALAAAIVGGCARRVEPAPQQTRAAASAPPPALATEQRFPLREGGTAVVGADAHVRILTADGGVAAESWCGDNGATYVRAVAFLTEVARLVAASDKNALADVVKLPLRAKASATTRAEFLAHYDQIFSPPEAAAIASADPGALFCRNGAFMLGDGVIWAEPAEAGSFRVITVNPVPSRLRH